MSQIERRFLISGVDRRMIAERGVPHGRATGIQQGYWDTPEHDILRVRVTESRSRQMRGELVRKVGHGVSRRPDRKEIDWSLAHWLYETCPYRVAKVRTVIDGWKIDEFRLPDGLMIAEIELASPDESFEIPPWIVGPTEITDTVNNLHIAKMAARTAGPFRAEALLKRLPRIVLTGGPCSGKSTVMRAIAEEMSDAFHCVPETATIVISMVGARPPQDEDAFVRFQQGLYTVQREFEALSEQQAFTDGKKALLMDRGTLDAAAYFKNGVPGFESSCHTVEEAELARYDAVICLSVPEREVYEANAANNAARSEDWGHAQELGDRVHDAWSGHPRVYAVPSLGSMQEKIDMVFHILAEIAESRP